jgi:hypothetical protein
MRSVQFGHYVPADNTPEAKGVSPPLPPFFPASDAMPPQEMPMGLPPLTAALQQDAFTPISPPPTNPDANLSAPPALRFGKNSPLQQTIGRLFGQKR